MGSASIAGYTLNSVVDVQRTFKKTVVEHSIPGAASIMQANGRPRDVIKITGILNPSAEITAVVNISQYANSAGFSGVAVTDVNGTDWVSTGNTYLLQGVEIKTQKGATVPWGKYTITIVEIS